MRIGTRINQNTFIYWNPKYLGYAFVALVLGLAYLFCNAFESPIVGLLMWVQKPHAIADAVAMVSIVMLVLGFTVMPYYMFVIDPRRTKAKRTVAAKAKLEAERKEAARIKAEKAAQKRQEVCAKKSVSEIFTKELTALETLRRSNEKMRALNLI